LEIAGEFYLSIEFFYLGDFLRRRGFFGGGELSILVGGEKALV